MEKIYSTKDLAEAAAIAVKGGRILNIERVGGVCWFIFENYKKCKQLSQLFFYGDLEVNARDYDQSLKRLKQMIFNNF